MGHALLHWLRTIVYGSTILAGPPVPLERGRGLWEAEGQGYYGLITTHYLSLDSTGVP